MSTSPAVVLLVCAGLLSGCADFSGTWAGSIAITGGCSDGSAIPAGSAPIEWLVTTSGSELSIVTQGFCGSFSAKQEGATALMNRKECPVQTEADGATVRKTLTSGTLALTRQNMSVSLNSSIEITAAQGRGTCSETATGLLARRQ